MTIKYKVSYLSDGTKVKITEELFNNLKVWEAQGYEIEDKFKDELKKQDDVWLNSHRQYYRNSSSLDAETEKENPNQSILLDTSQYVENIVLQNEREQIIYSIKNAGLSSIITCILAILLLQNRKVVRRELLEILLNQLSKC